MVISRISVCILGLIALAVIQGCSPAQITPIPNSADVADAQVLIYRESAFNAAGVPMIIGEDKSDYKQLWNEDYVELIFDEGSHVLYVRSNQADVPFRLPVELKQEGKKCLKGYANPSNWMKVFFPPAYFMGNTFLLEEVPCPSGEELSSFELVK